MGSQKETFSVNLEEKTQDYVWTAYKSTLGFFQKLCTRRSKYYVDIPWGYVDFKHETETHERPSCQGKEHEQNKELYSSEYENRTNEAQSYTFSTSRETVATTSIELQENYTIGAETNLEVDLGGIVKFGGGVSGEFSVTKTKGQEFSQTLSWNIDTEVKVPKWHEANATMYVFERPSVCDFTTKTTLSLPSGKFPCTVRRRSDNKEMHTEVILKITAIFNEEDFTNKSQLVQRKEIPVGNKIKECVELTTKGVCRNMSYKNQSVQVQCHKIKDAPPGAFS